MTSTLLFARSSKKVAVVAVGAATPVAQVAGVAFAVRIQSRNGQRGVSLVGIDGAQNMLKKQLLHLPAGGPAMASRWLVRFIGSKITSLTWQAIAAAADVKVVQQMLGHADASETLNPYRVLWPDRCDDVSIAFDVARHKTVSALVER